jgi:hypothetical protein
MAINAQDSNEPKESEQVTAASLEPPMSLERMAEILLALDPDTQADDSRFLLTIEDIQVLVITDVENDRMRVMTPIRAHEEISSGEMTRMMQANFDSALDARYAIAQGMLWSVFIHPFSPLQKNQFISGVGQVVNLSLTYGSLYSSGDLSFNAGDSGEINRRLIEELLERGEEV